MTEPCNRPRELFDPPESAVTNNVVALGYAAAPTSVHHRRLVDTANSAVSELPPTDTHPVSPWRLPPALTPAE